MSFRDTTFCSARDCQHFNTCHRALTDEVLAAAEKWWGGEGAPICQFCEPPTRCYEPRITPAVPAAKTKVAPATPPKNKET
jgi:hypothetical protein